MWATLFGVIESALTIVSALQYSDPFVSIGDGERMGSLADANKAIRNVKKARDAYAMLCYAWSMVTAPGTAVGASRDLETVRALACGRRQAANFPGKR